MIMLLLGMVDILAGITLLYPNFLGFYLGLIMLLKGGSSLLGGMTGNMMILILGVVDILAGVMILLSFSLPLIWLILIIKGFFSMVSGLGS